MTTVEAVDVGAPHRTRRLERGRRYQGGFTLLELMFVVIILMVLATVAVFSYQGYIRQARMQESVAFLGVMRLRQEAYFQSYSQYVDTGTNINDFYPTSIWPDACSGVPARWSMSCPADAATYPGWCALGVSPIDQGETLFQYMSIGWAPGDTISTCTGSGACLIPNPNRPWWIVVAQGDQRCDSYDQKSLVMMTSQSKNVVMFDVNEGNKDDDWANIGIQQNLAGAIQ